MPFIIVGLMDLQFDHGADECIIPSTAHFGNREIVFHTARNFLSRQKEQIKTMNFNAEYASKKWLCEKISEEMYLFSRQIKQGTYTEQECLIYSIKRILKHIVKNADEVGMYLEHKILYLTLKFILHLVCKRAANKNIAIDGQVTLHQWLVDVDALFFTPNNKHVAINGESNEDELLQSLKRKDYEGMLAHLQLLASKEPESPKKKKIQLIIKMLITKIEYQQIDTSLSGRGQEIKIANKMTFQYLQKQYRQNYPQEKEKKKNNKDKIEIIGEVLLGNYESIKVLIRDSWPLFVTHAFDMQSDQPLGQELKEQIKIFLNLEHKNAVLNLSQQTQYLLNLMTGKNLHIIYQSLFNFVSPFYSHLITYFFYYFYEASPLLTLMQEDYMTDLTRNLLDQSSQVSYLCLFFTFGLVENNDLIQRMGEMIQPLLYYHLSVVDFDDRGQIQQFLKKMRNLSTLSLQKYGFTHFRILLIQLFENNRLNQITVQAYLLFLAIYGKVGAYQFNMIDFTDRYFVLNSLSPQTLQDIMKVGQKFRGKKRFKKQYKEFERLYPSFEKFSLLNIAKNEAALEKKMETTIDLIKLTMRSLPLTQLVSEIEHQLKGYRQSSRLHPNQLELYYQFQRCVRLYLDHYPNIRSPQEAELIKSIDLMIS